MDLYESNTQAFVVRVWLEETTDESGRALWRGSITHVSDGRQRHFQNLDEIVSFIAPYLDAMGIHDDLPGRLK
jgi:hypothetical protein